MEFWMNIHTGTVGTKEDWLAGEGELVGRDGQFSFAEACARDELALVRKNLSGEWVEIPAYCAQNDGDCLTCSLVNYGKDCENNPVT